MPRCSWPRLSAEWSADSRLRSKISIASGMALAPLIHPTGLDFGLMLLSVVFVALPLYVLLFVAVRSGRMVLRLTCFAPQNSTGEQRSFRNLGDVSAFAESQLVRKERQNGQDITTATKDDGTRHA